MYPDATGKMRTVRKVNGPYFDKLHGRYRVEIVYTDGTRKGTWLARYRLEQHLGRALGKDETADHIDGDKTNDAVENLQVLSRADNIRKSKRATELFGFVCPICRDYVEKRASPHPPPPREGSGWPLLLDGLLGPRDSSAPCCTAGWRARPRTPPRADVDRQAATRAGA